MPAEVMHKTRVFQRKREVRKIEIHHQQMGLTCFRELLIPLVTPISAFSGVFFSTWVQFSATVLVPAPIGVVFLGNMSLI